MAASKARQFKRRTMGFTLDAVALLAPGRWAKASILITVIYWQMCWAQRETSATVALAYVSDARSTARRLSEPLRTARYEQLRLACVGSAIYVEQDRWDDLPIDQSGDKRLPLPEKLLFDQLAVFRREMASLRCPADEDAAQQRVSSTARRLYRLAAYVIPGSQRSDYVEDFEDELILLSEQSLGLRGQIGHAWRSIRCIPSLRKELLSRARVPSHEG